MVCIPRQEEVDLSPLSSFAFGGWVQTEPFLMSFRYVQSHPPTGGRRPGPASRVGDPMPLLESLLCAPQSCPPTVRRPRRLNLHTNIPRTTSCGSSCPLSSFHNGHRRRLSLTTIRISAQSSIRWRKRPASCTTTVHWNEFYARRIPNRTNALCVCGFDHAIWQRERGNTVVLAGTFTKFAQNPAIKHHLVDTDKKMLVATNPFDPAWSIGLRADDLDAHDPRVWRRMSLARGEERIFSGRFFLPSATSFGTMWTRRHTPRLLSTAHRHRLRGFMR